MTAKLCLKRECRSCEGPQCRRPGRHNRLLLLGQNLCLVIASDQLVWQALDYQQPLALTGLHVVSDSIPAIGVSGNTRLIDIRFVLCRAKSKEGSSGSGHA